MLHKFIDDQAGSLAALIAYYAFFSIFPLLLVLTTILGYVLAGNPALEQRIFSTALSQFPIIGQHSPTHPLTGNPAALVIGLVLAIWSGLGVAGVAQQAFNTVYGVPRAEWPWFTQQLLRSIELVVVGGIGLIITTLLQGAVSGADVYGLSLGPAGAVIGGVIGVVLNAALWPRGLRSLTEYRATTTADRVSYEAYPQRERQVYNLRVDAQVTNGQSDDGRP